MPGMTYPGSTEPPIIPASPPPPNIPTPAPPKKQRRGLIIGLVVAAVVILAGAGVVVLGLTGRSPISIPGISQGFQVRGTMTVTSCDNPGYDDISTGTEVTITDEAAKVLAVGRLTGGGTHCTFGFVIDNVPPGDKFYGITISHRGTLHYTEAQMRQELVLTLG